MVAGAYLPDQDPGAPPAVARQTILVVEDEPALLRALRINLRARGYEAVTVQAGRPALEKATQRKPDAVILDLGLPDLDGIDADPGTAAAHVRAGHRAVRPDRAG